MDDKPKGPQKDVQAGGGTKKKEPLPLDRRDELTLVLAKNIKKQLPRLQKLLQTCNSKHGGVDGIYRFYHQSFKVFYILQPLTLDILKAFEDVAPPADPPRNLAGRQIPGIGSMNEWFMQIVRDGTGKTFTYEANDRWLAETRPIAEAYFHAKYFLEMMIKYAETLERTPGLMDPGYAAVLYLYNLR